MHKYFIKIAFVALFSVGLAILQGCFYSYRFVTKKITVGYDSDVDSLGKVYLTIQYTGSNASILYKAKEKLPDSLLENLARTYFESERIRDSLKVEGIKFKKLGKGSGWTEKVDKDYLFIEGKNIAKIDTVWDFFLDDSTYAGTKVVLSILDNGSTLIVPNRGKEALKLKVSVSDSSIVIQGDEYTETYHKKAFFNYLFGGDY